jgi:hypothetical protein
MTEAKRVVTPNVQALADQLTQGAADRREQARKLYEWVSGHIRYVAIELGQGSLVPHDVDAILANGYGDCKDDDVLLQSLLKAKGIVSQSVLINGSASYEMPDVPSLATLNHVITYIPEFKLYLDSTAQVAPFGVLPMNEYGKPIVSVSDKEAALGKMALLAPGAAKRSFKTDVVLDKSGALTGTSTTTASGGYDVTLRGIALGIQAAGPVAAASSVLTRLGYKNGEGSFSMAPPQVMTPDYSITGTFTAQGWADEASGKSRFFLPGGLRRTGAVFQCRAKRRPVVEDTGRHEIRHRAQGPEDRGAGVAVHGALDAGRRYAARAPRIQQQDRHAVLQRGGAQEGRRRAEGDFRKL